MVHSSIRTLPDQDNVTGTFAQAQRRKASDKHYKWSQNNCKYITYKKATLPERNSFKGVGREKRQCQGVNGFAGGKTF